MYASVAKSFVRNEIASLIKKSNTKNFLSLSNLNFDIEKVAIQKNIEVHSCERDRNIFLKQREIAPKEVNLHLGDITELLSQKEFNFIWLDFCGNLSSRIINCLNTLKLTQPSDVIITLAMSRENKTSQKNYNLNLQHRENSIIDILNRYNLYTHKVYRYVNNKMPMAVFFTKNNILTETINVYQL